jgi:hypothetical protein
MDVGGCFFGFVVMEGHLWITTSKPTNYGRGNTRKAEQKKHTQKRGRMAHTTLSSNQHVDAGLESGGIDRQGKLIAYWNDKSLHIWDSNRI